MDVYLLDIVGKKVKPQRIFERLARYALFKYGDEFDEVAHLCPYETRMGGELAFRQELLWFIYEWHHPSTGNTVLDEFVADEITNKNMASNLLRRKAIIYDEFAVTQTDNTNLVLVHGYDTQQEYKVLLPASQKKYQVGDIFVGRIHPHDKDIYTVCGTLTEPGEWDDETFLERLKNNGASEFIIKSTMTLLHIVAERRFGPTQTSEDILSINWPNFTSNSGVKTLDKNSSNAHLLFSIDPEVELRIYEMEQKELAAFNAAMATPVHTNIPLKDAISRYTYDLLFQICSAANIPTLPIRDMMLHRICTCLPKFTCAQLSSMSRGERGIFACIFREKIITFDDLAKKAKKYFKPEYMNSFDDAEIEPMPDFQDISEYEDENSMLTSFVRTFMIMGIFTVGTARINGRFQQAVTIPHEIRDAISKCQDCLCRN